MKLSLSKKETIEYGRQHKLAMMLIFQATEDYIASRCCLLNGLFVGLVSAAQAVEKYLKGYALIINPDINVKLLSHNLKKLATEVIALDCNLSLNNYMPLIERLYSHYQSRYPDNPDKSTTQSTGELKEIDELVIYLVTSFPIPPEIKFRTSIFSHLFQQEQRNILFPSEKWLRENNLAIVRNLESFRNDFMEVYNHLYPKAT